MKQELRARFNAMTARYQPLIDPVIQAVQGKLEALQQMPVFAYMAKTAQRSYQQLEEFFKFLQLEAELRECLRQILRHTDRLTTQLTSDLKVIWQFNETQMLTVDCIYTV